MTNNYSLNFFDFSIILLLVSTVSMVCQLSRVDPALQPYLGWQPWCSCNQATTDTFTTT